jgi:hypothetical protein
VYTLCLRLMRLISERLQKHVYAQSTPQIEAYRYAVEFKLSLSSQLVAVLQQRHCLLVP